MASNKIKILFLDHTPFIGGAQLSLVDHMGAIDRKKFQIIYGCTENAKNIGLTKLLDEQKIDYRFFKFEKLKIFSPAALINFFNSVKELKSFVKKENIDIVFANTVRTHIISAFSANGAKLIWFMQDFTFPLPLFKLLKWIPDRIIYISKAAAANYHEKVTANNIVYLGSNFLKQDITEENANRIRQEWNIGNGEIAIGFVGRLVKWKGADLLIKAFKKLREEGITNVKCIIIGSGKNQDDNIEHDLKAYVLQNKLENVIFTGHRNDIAACMRTLDILCLTSIEPEPFGLVIVEAMMAKTLVIATNQGGPAEIIEEGKTGFLADIKESSFAHTLKKVINDNGLRNRVIETAYQKATEKFSVEKMTEKFEEIYLNL